MNDATIVRPNLDPLDSDALPEVLANENDDLLKRTAELLEGTKAWLDVKEIADEEEAESLADDMKMLGNICGDKGQGNVRRDARKRPYDTCAKTVQTFYMDKIITPLSTRRTKLLVLANGWLAKKRAAAEAEARRKREQAAKEMAEAKTAEQVKAAAATMKEADKAGSAKVKSDFGSSIHQSSRWAYEVTDFAKVPDKFKVIDQTAVMAFIKTGTVENPVKIEGIVVKRVTGAVGG